VRNYSDILIWLSFASRREEPVKSKLSLEVLRVSFLKLEPESTLGGVLRGNIIDVPLLASSVASFIITLVLEVAHE